MAHLIHEHSSECLLSELDVFSVPCSQTSIESSGYLEYNPVSSLNDGTPVEFFVNGSGDYIDLANSLIHVKVKITKADGTNIDGADNVGPANLLLHTMFSEVDVKLNDVMISSTNNTYPYRSYIETLLSYGPSAKRSQLTSEMYYKDQSGRFEVGEPGAAADVGNSGFTKRSAFFAGSAVVEMIGPIHSDIFFSNRFLPSNIGMRLRFVRSKDSFCLMSNEAGAAYKLKIVEFKLLIRKAKLSSSVVVAHAKALEVGNFRYPIRRVICKTFTVPAGNLNCSQENLFSGQLPTRLVIGCVDNDSYNGLYQKAFNNFKNLNASQIKLFIDGQQQFVRPIDVNYPANQYLSAYVSLFNATGKHLKDEGLDIDREDYPNGYCLYAFDLTPDLGEEDHFNLAIDGTVRLDIAFRAALANTINVVVYAEYDSLLEISRDRSIIQDFNG